MCIIVTANDVSGQKHLIVPLFIRAELDDPYQNLLDWNENNPDCCKWTQRPGKRVTTCDKNGRVTSLRMGTAIDYRPQPVWKRVNGGMYGESLGSLTSLQLLDIRTVYSAGASIPSSWKNLHSLANVTLDVLLGGSLPGSIVGTWPLQGLDLQNNELSGAVPALLCKSVLRSLKLSGNKFSGKIPSCLSRFPASSFGPDGNAGLCGTPLPPCK